MKNIAYALAMLVPLSSCVEQSPPAAQVDSNIEHIVVEYDGYNIDFLREIHSGDWRNGGDILSGELLLPADEKRHPVVVLQHGSGVPDHPNYRAWKAAFSEALLNRGIGVFFADSYSGRRIGETTKDQGKLSRASRAIDAVMALQALSRQPRVDASKIGIIGFSFGGAIANMTSNELFVRRVIQSEVQYAAHVALYPACGTDFAEYVSTGAPILIMFGLEDDFINREQCIYSTENMRRGGANVTVVEYEDAAHGFISSKPVYWNETAWQFRKCPKLTIDSDGEERGDNISSEGKSWSEFVRLSVKSCGKRGGHIGRNSAAADDSLDRSVEFFSENLLN